MSSIIENEVDRSLDYWWSKMTFVDDRKEAEDVKEEHDLLIPQHVTFSLEIQSMLLHVSDKWRTTFF